LQRQPTTQNKGAGKVVEISTFLMTAGTLLTAVFTGGTMWLKMQENKLAVIPSGDGTFLLSNPSQRTVVVRDLVAEEGTLWTCLTPEAYNPTWGDGGKKVISLNMQMPPFSEELFHEGICSQGQRCMVKGKVRRVHWHQPWFVDVVLYPGTALHSPKTKRRKNQHKAGGEKKDG
jgi:hypothetical protein